MFNNALGISVVECTTVCEIHDVIRRLSDNRHQMWGCACVTLKMQQLQYANKNISKAVCHSMVQLCPLSTYKHQLLEYSYLLQTTKTKKKKNQALVQKILTSQAHVYREGPSSLS